ncbi:MAG TPA: hypothetical protein VF881_02835, partial [Polyangiaceae bacterium]
MKEHVLSCTGVVKTVPRSLRRWAALGSTAALLASVACGSQQPQEESTAAVQQPLDAGQYVLLNELKINPSGTDYPYEYIELIGTPGLSLAGFQVVVIDAATGTVKMVVDLGTACGGSACMIGTNGLLIIKASDVDGGVVGHTPAAATTVVKDDQLRDTDVIPNNAAVLLVEGSTLIAENSTLTAGDAGSAVLPADDSLVDGVGWGASGGKYSGVTLTQSSGNPDAATRIPGRVDQTAGAWYNGDLLGQTDGGDFP